MAADVERRLTCILSADVVGFSRLMGLDETSTLETLNAYRAVMDGMIRGHQGRLVSAAGDGVLAEFASPVMAVRCGVEIQRALDERNARLPADRRMDFRIGINLGDVIVEEGDIFGDDVNIAARLQAMAEPGGILISGTVFDQVKHKLQLGFDFLGPQHLKNVTMAVPVYRANLGPGGKPGPKPAEKAGAQDPRAPRPKSPAGLSAEERKRRLTVSALRGGAVVGLLLLINVFSWDGEIWFQWPALAVLFILAMRAIQLYRV